MAGTVFEVNFPRIMTFHNGEHVVSLWFSDLVNISAIKVSG